VTTRTKALTIALAALAVLLVSALLFSPLRVLVDDPADGEPVRGVDTVAVDEGEFVTPVIEVPRARR
jgi:hypothetical protein